MARSIDELIEILRRIDNLPVREVKSEVNRLYLKFDEWQSITNHNLGFFPNLRDVKDEDKPKFNNEVKITYREYLRLQELPVSREYDVRQANIAKTARKERNALLNDEGEPDREERLERFSEEKVQKLEEIERLWDDVIAKYDPEELIESIAKETSKIFMYISDSNIEDRIERMEKNIEQFKKCAMYVGDKYRINKPLTEEDNEIIESLEQIKQTLENIQNSHNLSVDEFIDTFGLDKDEMFGNFKKRIEKAEKTPDLAPFVKRKEGKAFRINENGELEVNEGEEKLAKNIISESYLDEALEEDLERKLEKISHYGSLISKYIDRYDPENENNEAEEENDGNESKESILERINDKHDIAEGLNEEIKNLEELVEKANENNDKSEGEEK